MMFPVNRKANELTAAELLDLYDQSVTEAKTRATSPDHPTVSTVAELRAEIERRLAPCTREHFSSWYNQQMQGLQAVSQAAAQSQLGREGNR